MANNSTTVGMPKSSAANHAPSSYHAVVAYLRGAGYNRISGVWLWGLAGVVVRVQPVGAGGAGCTWAVGMYRGWGMAGLVEAIATQPKKSWV